MHIGSLAAVPALDRLDLLAAPVAAALTALAGKLATEDVGVAEIDPALADTAAFCERYGVAPPSRPTASWWPAAATARRGWPRAWCSPPRALT